MGTWGSGLFQDDLACDVRDAYRASLASGLDGPRATRQVMEDFADDLEDEYEAPTVWLALAATQWQVGRLEDRVRKKALAIIGSGDALRRWEENPAGAKAFGRTLAKLRIQLESPQPPEKRIRPAPKFRDFTALKAGQVFSYRLPSGRQVLFQVTSLWNDAHTRFADIALFDWIGDAAPGPDRIRRLRLRPNRWPDDVSKWETFCMFEKKNGLFPAERVKVLLESGPLHDLKSGGVLTDWGHLDERLLDLGLK